MEVNYDDNFYSSAGKRVPARIFLKVVDDPIRAQELNMPAKKEVECIELYADSSTTIVRELTEQDRETFAGLYARFQQTRQPTSVDGVPLSELTWISRARAEEYYGMKVFSVEQLAAAKEEIIKKAGLGAREEVAKAKAYLKAAKDTKFVTTLAAECETLKAQVTALQEENKSLLEAIKEMKAKAS